MNIFDDVQIELSEKEIIFNRYIDKNNINPYLFYDKLKVIQTDSQIKYLFDKKVIFKEEI